MWTANWIAYIALVAVTIAAGIIDARKGIVPNRLTYPAVILGMLYWLTAGLAVGGWSQGRGLLGDSSFAMACGLIPYAVLVLTMGLGGGDMKLMAAVGAISGRWEVVLSTTVYALLLAAAMAIVVMFKRGMVKEVMGRILGAALMRASKVKADLPTDGPKVPFAVAVAVGAMLAGAEQMLGLVTPWQAMNP